MSNNEECLKCGHKWEPRIEEKPLACPKCKSYTWGKPVQRPARKE